MSEGPLELTDTIYSNIYADTNPGQDHVVEALSETVDGGLREASGEPTEYTTETVFIAIDEFSERGVETPKVSELEAFELHSPNAPSTEEGPIASKAQRHSLSFHDITYEVTVRKLCFKQENKQILKSVRWAGLLLCRAATNSSGVWGYRGWHPPLFSGSLWQS